MPTVKCWMGLNAPGSTLVFVYTGAMSRRAFGNGRFCGEVMTRPMLLIAVVMAVGVFAQPLLAFQEEGGGPGKGAAVPAEAPAPAGAALPGKNLNLKVPEVSLGQGTEVRIPGFGKVGVLPKLDFGLELLYGATDTRGRPDDKSEPSDVQIRGTIKHRF